MEQTPKTELVIAYWITSPVFEQTQNYCFFLSKETVTLFPLEYVREHRNMYFLLALNQEFLEEAKESMLDQLHQGISVIVVIAPVVAYEWEARLRDWIELDFGNSNDIEIILEPHPQNEGEKQKSFVCVALIGENQPDGGFEHQGEALASVRYLKYADFNRALAISPQSKKQLFPESN